MGEQLRSTDMSAYETPAPSYEDLSQYETPAPSQDDLSQYETPAPYDAQLEATRGAARQESITTARQEVAEFFDDMPVETAPPHE